MLYRTVIEKNAKTDGEINCKILKRKKNEATQNKRKRTKLKNISHIALLATIYKALIIRVIRSQLSYLMARVNDVGTFGETIASGITRDISFRVMIHFRDDDKIEL